MQYVWFLNYVQSVYNTSHSSVTLGKMTPFKNLWDIGKALVCCVVLGLPFMQGHFWCHVSKPSLVVPESKHRS